MLLRAVLDGIRRRVDPGPPVNVNIFAMTDAEKVEHGIRQLPDDLRGALVELEKNEVMKDALGEHIFAHYVAAKNLVWRQYSSQVHDWELNRYLATY